MKLCRAFPQAQSRDRRSPVPAALPAERGARPERGSECRHDRFKRAERGHHPAARDQPGRRENGKTRKTVEAGRKPDAAARSRAAIHFSHTRHDTIPDESLTFAGTALHVGPAEDEHDMQSSDWKIASSIVNYGNQILYGVKNSGRPRSSRVALVKAGTALRQFEDRCPAWRLETPALPRQRGCARAVSRASGQGRRAPRSPTGSRRRAPWRCRNSM